MTSTNATLSTTQVTALGDACTQLANAGTALDAAVRLLHAAGLSVLATEITGLTATLDAAASAAGTRYVSAQNR